jgi:hypothetical protein
LCFQAALQSAANDARATEFQVIAVQQHMHVLGKAMKTELVRSDGTVAVTIGDMPNYNIHEQQMRLLAQPFSVGPTDSLKVTCVYNSSGRVLPTRLGTQREADEMCFSYMLITPAIGLTHCWHSSYIGECEAKCAINRTNPTPNLFFGCNK